MARYLPHVFAAALVLCLTLACGVGPISNPITANPTVAAAATSLANAQATLGPALATVQSGVATFGPTAQAFIATAQSGIATFGPTAQSALQTAQAGVASAVVIGVSTATPAADGFASGGLGLARAAWEAQHGAGTDAGGSVEYEEKTYVVGFQGENVASLERIFNPAVSLDEARGQAKALLPADSQLAQTSESSDGGTVEVYQSAALAARLPATGGDCTATYRQSGGGVMSVVLRWGKNP